ncbi:sulfotransferase family protein [Profundibacterium mesophilum]|uniref:Sulfotransferase domain-containing protein n=1 Tax=Profundibacterium mesophilum KAUST100406-0324 TaxID=1037889 RepID=A0A921NSI7_9RHOB|nr:sulfotransferase family protein [Profundibacterium mesophilum]KAF0674598.1 hypothetical protein PMES_02980 [Profundibacterium mesophilum KAUST100406-0324]
MSKTLIIHIGHYKTGTTALQVFASENRRFLASRGIKYPKPFCENCKHSDYAFSVLRAAGVRSLMHGYDKPLPPEDMWQQLFKQVRASRTPQTLISSEEFMRIGQFEGAERILADILDARPEGIEVKAVCYLRPPAEHLSSWYNQLIKLEMPISELETAVNGEIEEIHYDYRRALVPWVRMLGASDVTIRPYLRDASDPASLHRDFFTFLGIELPDKLAPGPLDHNPRLDDRLVELMRVLQNSGLERPVLRAARAQAQAFIAAQDAAETPRGMSRARALAQEGLDWIADLPGSSVPVERFAGSLPQARPKEQTESVLLLGFVLSEFLRHRQRVNKPRVDELEARIAALEAALTRI